MPTISAADIVSAVGGAGNVESLSHCATRLRFQLRDSSLVDTKAVEAVPGVLGAVPQAGNRFQIVIGGAVQSVYNDILAQPGISGGDAAGDDAAAIKAAARAKGPRGKAAWLDTLFEYLSDSFRPILGALLGASLFITFMSLMATLDVIPSWNAPGVTLEPSWAFINLCWQCVFVFLPLMIAYNASAKAGADPWVGFAVMAVLMLPGFAALRDDPVGADAGGGRLRNPDRRHLRDPADAVRLQLTGVPTAADGGHPRRALQAAEEAHPVERPSDLRAVLRDADHDSVDSVHHRPDRRLRRRRSRRSPEVRQRLLAVHLRDRHPAGLPVHGAVGTALADQRDHADQHPDARLRLHPGPDGCMELRMLRRHRGRVVPRLARAGLADEADLDRCVGGGSARRHLRTIALRHPPEVQADLPTHVGRLLHRRPDHRHRRRRHHQRLRVHVAADDPRVRPDRAVRHRRHRRVRHRDGAGDPLRLPHKGATGGVRGLPRGRSGSS